MFANNLGFLLWCCRSERGDVDTRQRHREHAAGAGHAQVLEGQTSGAQEAGLSARSSSCVRVHSESCSYSTLYESNIGAHVLRN